MKYCGYCGKRLDGQPCTCEGYLEVQAIEAATKESEPVVEQVADQVQEQVESHVEDQVQAPEEEQTKAQKASKNTIKVAAFVVALCVIIGGIAGYSYFANSFDLSEYIEVYNVRGVDGAGSISYGFKDDGSFYEAYFGDEYANVDTENLTEAELLQIIEREKAKEQELRNIIECVEFAASKEEDLCNGDVVTITATFDNPNNYDFSRRIKSGEITYTVADLPEGKLCDPFNEDDVSISIIGSNGSGRVLMDVPHKVPYSYMTYNVSPMAGLSNGDTVTVWVNCDEGVLVADGYLPPDVWEKEIIVSDLGNLIQSESEISQSIIDEICQTVLEKTNARFENRKTGCDVISEPKIDKLYFARANEGTIQEGFLNDRDIRFENAIIAVSSYSLQDAYWGNTYNDKYVWVIPECTINEEGTVKCDLDNMKRIDYSYDSVYQDIVNKHPNTTFVELQITQ